MTVTLVPVVDISLNQGLVDMAKMRAGGVQGLILRVSHGKTLDSNYPTYYRTALTAGFAPDDICHYTFVNPKRGIAAQCAQATLDEIYRVVGHVDVGYMIDVENYRDQSPNIGAAPVYGPAFATYLREGIAEVTKEAPGARQFGYTNRAYWNGKVPGTTEEWVGDDALAASLDWLCARYPAYSDAAYARLDYPGHPDTWQDWAYRAQPQGPFPPRGGTWVGWQFAGGWDRQGPVYGATSRDLDLNIVHPDNWAQWTGKTVPDPQPQPEDDDMEIRLITLADSDAQFMANTTTDGRTDEVWWVGTSKLSAMRDAHEAAATAAGRQFRQPQNIAWLINTRLKGPLPTGDSRHTWTGDEFAAIDPTAFDQVARDGVARLDGVTTALNDSVGRLGQRQSVAGVELAKAADALMGT